MTPCMLCGKPTGEFIGLCDPCCRLIKAKSDAFARSSRRKLEESMKQPELKDRISYDVVFTDDEAGPDSKEETSK